MTVRGLHIVEMIVKEFTNLKVSGIGTGLYITVPIGISMAKAQV